MKNHYLSMIQRSKYLKLIYEQKIMLEVVIVIFLLGASLFGYKLIRKFEYISESLLATIIGICAGAVIYSTGNKEIILEIEKKYVLLFLIVLLPPIIFQRYQNFNISSFFLKRKPFIRNFGTIIIFAV